MLRGLTALLALTFTPVVATAQQPCTSDTRHVVNELYRHMLERQAETASGYWLQQLQSGGMTVRDVVRGIAKSREHTERFFTPEAGEAVPYERSVARFYRHILGRQPDAAGQRAFAQLAQSQGAGAVVDEIVDSAEYTERFGDWGVPGSGGTRYCAPDGRTVNQAPASGSGVRFAGMDRNGDGVITRAEWRGNYQSFSNQDWNRDGVLSGNELDPASGRPTRTADDREARRAERFAALDINGNGRIEAREWDGTVVVFNRLDGNNDNVLTRAEVVGPGFDDVDSVAAPNRRFDSLDVNNNGRIEPREWNGTVAAFYRLDIDNDNVLTRSEVVNSRGDAPRPVATTGQEIRVEGRERWTDTFLTVRAGDTLVFDADGSVRLSADSSDVANVGGALSGRRAADAQFADQRAGALIGRIGNASTFFVGNRGSVRAPASGRLYLGVNDDYLEDNAGDFQVRVTIQR